MRDDKVLAAWKTVQTPGRLCGKDVGRRSRLIFTRLEYISFVVPTVRSSHGFNQANSDTSLNITYPRQVQTEFPQDRRCVTFGPMWFDSFVISETLSLCLGSSLLSGQAVKMLLSSRVKDARCCTSASQNSKS